MKLRYRLVHLFNKAGYRLTNITDEKEQYIYGLAPSNKIFHKKQSTISQNGLFPSNFEEWYTHGYLKNDTYLCWGKKARHFAIFISEKDPFFNMLMTKEMSGYGITLLSIGAISHFNKLLTNYKK